MKTIGALVILRVAAEYSMFQADDCGGIRSKIHYVYSRYSACVKLLNFALLPGQLML